MRMRVLMVSTASPCLSVGVPSGILGSNKDIKSSFCLGVLIKGTKPQTAFFRVSARRVSASLRLFRLISS